MHTSQLIPFRRRATVQLFSASIKCQVAIPVRDVLMRYALQEASLDPSVKRIRYKTGPDIECPRVSLTGVILDCVDGSFLLKVSERRPKRNAEELACLSHVLKSYGLQLRERDAFDIKREPVFSNARAVWEHEGRPVPIEERLEIGYALLEYGPQSISQLEKHVKPTFNVLAAVCALACEGLVNLNIEDTRLGRGTIVAETVESKPKNGLG
jgi:hypothetical protein